MKWLKFNLAAVVLFLALGAGVVYTVIENPNKKVRVVRAAQVIACQRAIAKADIIVAAFNRYAVDKEADAANEDAATAKRDKATAALARSLSAQYLKLTPQDCSIQFPAL